MWKRRLLKRRSLMRFLRRQIKHSGCFPQINLLFRHTQGFLECVLFDLFVCSPTFSCYISYFIFLYNISV
jgi:hypothetical protein